MDYKIILPLRSLSEKEFFSIVQKNKLVSLKHFYKKISVRHVYRILNSLENLQSHLGAMIFVKKTDFCNMTSHPIIFLDFKINVEIKEFDNKEFFAIISTL